ncbi:hypothetical protein BASA81_005361 [Batrachochytrium salamandrivorans]|nr:hypothetical protein BASA81_005361 [Batrachochytrium salamandrivorans]
MLIARFLELAKQTPNKVLFEFANERGDVVTKYTYLEFETKTRVLAQTLASGHKGQPALLVYPPGLDFIVAFVACLRAGVVAVPVYPPRGVKSKDLAMFLTVAKSCGAKLALTNSAYNWGTKALSIRELLRSPFGDGGDGESRGVWPEDLQWMVTDSFSTGLGSVVGVTAGVIDVDLTPNQVAFLQYTSGSTSAPKGVVLTHDNLAHNLQTICLALKADSTVQVVSWLPMYHDMGLIGSHLGTMYCGGSALLFSPVSFVKNPVLWLELVTRKRATHLQAPNFAYRLTCRKFLLQPGKQVKLDLSSVRHCFNAAEPIDAQAMDEFCTTFSVFGFDPEAMVPGYGLAEHTVYVCDGGKQRLHLDRVELETRGRVIITAQSTGGGGLTLVGLGNPPPQSQVRMMIVDPATLEKLDQDCVGEIWLTSRSKSAQYFGMPDLSQRDLHAKLAASTDVRRRRSSSAGGEESALDLPRAEATEQELELEWLRTGDLGFLHQGELFVCGRIKDLIIVRGRNHFPQDLEHTAELAASAQIRPGCVGAFAWGEDDGVVIVAEMRPGVSNWEASCDAIRVAIGSEHGVSVSAICLIKDRTIPKTTSGKLSRHRIRNAYAGNTLQVVHEWKSSAPTNGVGEEEVDAVNSNVAINSNAAATGSKQTPEQILLQLQREVVSLLELNTLPSQVSSTTSMHELGFDSMMLTQLKGAIINVFQVEVDDEVLYGETCTLEQVRDMIASLQNAPPPSTLLDQQQPTNGDTESRSSRRSNKPKRPLIAGFKKGQKCGFCGC